MLRPEAKQHRLCLFCVARHVDGLGCSLVNAFHGQFDIIASISVAPGGYLSQDCIERLPLAGASRHDPGTPAAQSLHCHRIGPLTCHGLYSVAYRHGSPNTALRGNGPQCTILGSRSVYGYPYFFPNEPRSGSSRCRASKRVRETVRSAT